MPLEEEKEGLLQEIRILDLADEKASFCSKLLADLGAYVVKVEKPGGDPSRKIGPFLGNSPHPERSLFFYYHNTNKLGITLNLEHPMGREIFLRLIRLSKSNPNEATLAESSFSVSSNDIKTPGSL